MIFESDFLSWNLTGIVQNGNDATALLFGAEATCQDIPSISHQIGATGFRFFDGIRLLPLGFWPSNEVFTGMSGIDKGESQIGCLLLNIGPMTKIDDRPGTDIKAQVCKCALKCVQAVDDHLVGIMHCNMNESIRIAGLDNVLKLYLAVCHPFVGGPACRGNGNLSLVFLLDGMEDDILLQNVVVLEGLISRVKDMYVTNGHFCQEQFSKPGEVGAIAETAGDNRD